MCMCANFSFPTSCGQLQGAGQSTRALKVSKMENKNILIWKENENKRNKTSKINQKGS